LNVCFVFTRTGWRKNFEMMFLTIFKPIRLMILTMGNCTGSKNFGHFWDTRVDRIKELNQNLKTSSLNTKRLMISASCPQSGKMKSKTGKRPVASWGKFWFFFNVYQKIQYLSKSLYRKYQCWTFGKVLSWYARLEGSEKPSVWTITI